MSEPTSFSHGLARVFLPEGRWMALPAVQGPGEDALLPEDSLLSKQCLVTERHLGTQCCDTRKCPGNTAAREGSQPSAQHPRTPRLSLWVLNHSSRNTEGKDTPGKASRPQGDSVSTSVKMHTEDQTTY